MQLAKIAESLKAILCMLLTGQCSSLGKS